MSRDDGQPRVRRNLPPPPVQVPRAHRLVTWWHAGGPGRIAPALLLWFLGVPGGVVLLLWFFLWRGK